MKKSFLFIAVIFFSMTVFGFAFASTQTRERSAEQKEKAGQVLAEKRSQLAVKNCDRVESKIENRISNYDHQKEKHVESYLRTKEKIKKLITKLQEKGYDTAKLAEDLVIFDAKIQKFADDYAKYVSILRESKTLSCGEAEGQFRAKLKEAKTQLKVVHDDAVDIRTFYAKTIRVDVKAIKDTIPKTDETEDSSDNNPSNN